MRSGFFDPFLEGDMLEQWHRLLLADDWRLRVVHDPDPRPFGLDQEPVATFASIGGTVNTGGTLAPASLITDVTVQASHQRRGLMKRLMTTDLSEARERGDVFALLTATDGLIYGRFGFGVATNARRLEINTGDRFQLTTAPTGRAVFADPTKIIEVRQTIFEQFHANQFMSVSRPAHHWHTGYDWYNFRSRDDRAAVHLDESGTPDAAVVFSIEKDRVRIVDLLGTNPAAEIELIRLLGHSDGGQLLLWEHCNNIQHPLPWALVDPRLVRTTAMHDTIWMRILDVEQALRIRAWERDGQIRLGVDDPLGDQSATFNIRVADDTVEVSRTNEPAEAMVAMRALAPLYSGLQEAGGLAAAGLVQGGRDELLRLGALFGRTSPPVSASLF